MKVRRFTKAGGRKRESDQECRVMSSGSGAGDHWTVDLMIRIEDGSMVAVVNLTPDEADELAGRMTKHAAWCRQTRTCETTCGPARLSGRHVDACPFKHTY